MAIQRGCFGPISGKVGDRVYVIKNGVNYVRSLPRKTTKPATEKQKIWRAKFALATDFLQPITRILNSSYKLINPKKTGTGLVLRQILDEAIIGDYPDLEIDYAKVRLIHGNLASPYKICVRSEKPGQLNFTWLFEQRFNVCPGDELLILVYCISLKEFWCNEKTGIQRSDECGSIRLPEEFAGKECCVWLAYRSVQQNAWSDSVYPGKVIPKEPAS